MKEFPNIEKYLPKDSVDYQRLVSFQEKAASRGYGEGHLWLASMAAFPVFLTPDLLYKIWLNFRHISLKENKSQDIDRMAVSDLLLSNLVEEIAVEVFCIRPPIRTALLALLEEWSKLVVGKEPLMKRLADFTLRYVRSYQMEGESVTTAIREAQEWNALAYFNPNVAALTLKKALSQAVQAQAKQKVLRISFLLERMDEQFGQLEQAEQQEHFRTLVNYSQGMQALIRGQEREAIKAFKAIKREKQPTDQTSSTGSQVHLPIPKEIYQAIASEEIVEPTEAPYRIFALLVGIGKYGKEAALPYLEGVGKDLEFWKNYFTERVQGQVQVNSLLNGAATKAAVMEALQLECSKAVAGDQVFFFFSGHGQNQVDGQEGCTLLLHDYNQDAADSGRIRESEFQRIVEGALPPGATCTIFLDTHSGGSQWLNTTKAGRFIYNATDIDQRAAETREGGHLTRAFRQVMEDIGSRSITHIELVRRLREAIEFFSIIHAQTPTWYGSPDSQETAFLALPAPTELRLRELMVQTGLARSIQPLDVPAVLEKFQQDYAIGEQLSVKKALAIWAAIHDKTFKVFLSQSGQSFAIRSYLEDLLFDKNIPHEVFTHDLQREIELQMQKAQPLVEKDWRIQIVEADFIVLQIDADWIKDPVTVEVVNLLALRLMESQVPYLLLYANTCAWTSHPVSQLGQPWPANSIAVEYKEKAEEAFITDWAQQLAPTIDYVEIFLGDAQSSLDVELFQGQLLERIITILGRLYPVEVARLDKERAGRAEQLAFIQAHYPAPIGQALDYLYQPKPNSAQMRASFESWQMLIHTLNTFLLALLRQLVLRREKGVKEQLEKLDVMEQLANPGWFSRPVATAQFIEILTGTEALRGLLEELGLREEAWRQLTGRDLPASVDEATPSGMDSSERAKQLRSVLSRNYGLLMQWFERLEVLVDVKWDNLCQLYSIKTYSPLLFHAQGINPSQENTHFYRLSHQVGAGKQLHFQPLTGAAIVIEKETEDIGQIWEDFQALLQLLGAEKEVPVHPQQLQALLVGINNYPSPLPSLRAPENDIAQFRTYLDQQPLPAHTEMLSGAVTKANIVETLTQIVNKAEPGDAVIFYFSGLGQKEQSPNPEETIPALLTHDQQRMPIDEIVYLLCQDKGKALHPIIILDMGSNAKLSKEQLAAGWRAKGIDAIAPARNWENYGFSEEIRNVEDWTAFMNEAPFVLMVGCDYDHETALEDDEGSFFTRNLISVLSRSRHFLPYPVLQERLSDVLHRQVPQTPDIRVEGPSVRFGSPNFLGQASVDFQPLYGRVEWNRRLQQWTIDMGTKWGLSNQQIVHICTADYKENKLAPISYAYEDFSTLAFGDRLPDPSQSYLGFVDDFLRAEPLRLSLRGWNEELQAAAINALGGSFPGVDFGAQADYDFVFQAEPNGFRIQPATVERGFIYRAETEAPIHQFDGTQSLVRKMAVAKALASLSNADETQDPFAEDLGIGLWQVNEKGQTKRLETNLESQGKDQHYRLDFEQLKRFQIQVKNEAAGRRYLALLLIRTDLAVSSLLKAGQAEPLPPGETLTSESWRTVLPITEENEDKPAYLHTVKIIASDQPFDPTYWLQSGLSIPGQEEETSQASDDAIALPHDNLWSICTIRIEDASKAKQTVSIPALQEAADKRELQIVFEQLFSLLPLETAEFDQLVSLGSRYFEIKRLTQYGLVEERDIYVLQNRLTASVADFLKNADLIQYTRGKPENARDKSRKREWFYQLMKDGIGPSIQVLPSLYSLSEKESTFFQEQLASDFRRRMVVANMLQPLEETMISYSKGLKPLIEAVLELDVSASPPTEQASTAPHEENFPLVNWEQRTQLIKNQIVEGKIPEAIEGSLALFPEQNITQEILLLQANYALTEREQRRGLIRQSDITTRNNRIAFGLITIIDLAPKLSLHQPIVQWNSEQQQALLSSLAKEELEEAIAKLVIQTRNLKTLQNESENLQVKHLNLLKDSKIGMTPRNEYYFQWIQFANTFLDIVRRLPEAQKHDLQPGYVDDRPADLTLTINRSAQYDQFSKALVDQSDGLQVFLILAPPKSAPQHFLKRLAWSVKPSVDSSAIILDTITLEASTSLHRLSSHLEKAWQDRLQTADLSQAESLMTSLHFTGDWFEHKENLAAWFASEGDRRVQQKIAPQLIAIVIVEAPAESTGGTLGKLFQRDPIKQQVHWLEQATEAYPNAHFLPILNKVSRKDLRQWIQGLPDDLERDAPTLDIPRLKSALATEKEGWQFVLKQLEGQAAMHEQDEKRLSLIRAELQELERSQLEGTISHDNFVQQRNKLISALIALLDGIASRQKKNLEARDRRELLERLEEELGPERDGYHMEDVLQAIQLVGISIKRRP